MPSAQAGPQTLYDKVWNDHIVNQQEDGTVLLYIGKIQFIDTIMLTCQ